MNRKRFKNPKLPEAVLKAWEIDKKNLLLSMHRQKQELIFKFSFHVDTGEFLLDVRPIFHAEMIQKYGAHKFEDYIRGIYFEHKRTVYLRGHEREDWLEETEKMLRANGVPKSIRVVWGVDAARELAEDLKGL